MQNTKLAIKELTIGFVSGAVLLAAVAAFLWPLRTLNSPIRVVGGSIKFKAAGAWGKAMPQPTTCSSLPCLISSSPIDGTEATLDQNATLKNLVSWKIVVNIFDQNGVNSQLGVTIYPSDNSGTCTADGVYKEAGQPDVGLCATSATTFITSQTPAMTKLFAPDGLYDKKKNKARRRYRYRDTQCCNDGTEDYSESVSDITIYYMFQSGVATKQSTSCGNDDSPDNGECKVYIGKL